MAIPKKIRRKKEANDFFGYAKGGQFDGGLLAICNREIAVSLFRKTEYLY